MKFIKIFIASSYELEVERRAIEILAGRLNKRLVRKGLFIELVMWEDFLDTISPTRLQDEYNKEIIKCDIFIMLFHSKVGEYTKEEFFVALEEFRKNQKPQILTYFKKAATAPVSQEQQKSSLSTFLSQLESFHFYTAFQSVEQLQLHLSQQFDRILDTFIINDSDVEIGSSTPINSIDSASVPIDINLLIHIKKRIESNLQNLESNLQLTLSENILTKRRKYRTELFRDISQYSGNLGREFVNEKLQYIMILDPQFPNVYLDKLQTLPSET